MPTAEDELLTETVGPRPRVDTAFARWRDMQIHTSEPAFWTEGCSPGGVKPKPGGSLFHGYGPFKMAEKKDA